MTNCPYCKHVLLSSTELKTIVISEVNSVPRYVIEDCVVCSHCKAGFSSVHTVVRVPSVEALSHVNRNT